MSKGPQAYKEHFTEADLSRKIVAFGQVRIIGDATTEEFDEYIYSILKQMYQKQGHAMQRYELSFDHDWRYLGNRLNALNELYRLNLARRSARPAKEKIPLFVEVEEEEQAYA